MNLICKIYIKKYTYKYQIRIKYMFFILMFLHNFFRLIIIFFYHVQLSSYGFFCIFLIKLRRFNHDRFLFKNS
jgi:hypothetical protein